MVQLANRFTIKCRTINGTIVDYNERNNFENIQCACTYLINTRGCDQESSIRLVFKVVIAYTILVSLTSLCFLYYRWSYRKRALPFGPSKIIKDILRPKPQEAFHVCAFVFGLVVSIHYAFVLFDGYPSIAWAFVGASIPRVCAFSLGALYTIGIINLTLRLCDCKKEHVFLLHYRIIDAIKLFYLIMPSVSIFPLSYLWGYHFDQDEMQSSTTEKIAKAYNGVWDIYLITYMICLVYFWLKMRRILKNYIAKAKEKMEANEEEPRQLSHLRSAAKHFMIMVIISVTMIITGVVVDSVHERFKDSGYLFRSTPFIVYSITSLLQTPFLAQVGQFITISSEYHAKSRFRGLSEEVTEKQQIPLSPYVFPSSQIQSPSRTLLSPLTSYHDEVIRRSTITINSLNNGDGEYRTSESPFLLSPFPPKPVARLEFLEEQIESNSQSQNNQNLSYSDNIEVLDSSDVNTSIY